MPGSVLGAGDTNHKQHPLFHQVKSEVTAEETQRMAGKLPTTCSDELQPGWRSQRETRVTWQTKLLKNTDKEKIRKASLQGAGLA